MLTIGSLLARVEAPAQPYRVTSRVSAAGIWRLLPYRSSGREVLVTELRNALVGDGSAWRPYTKG